MEQEQEKGLFIFFIFLDLLLVYFNPNISKITESKVDEPFDYVQTSSTLPDYMGAANTNALSEDEQKIRDELESEIERDLEEEIKDGMYGLAIRLQRLYLHKQRRKRSASSTSSNTEPSHRPKSERLSELNIIIRSDGKSKIGTYEVKPSFRDLVRPYSSRSEAKKVKLRNCFGRFDQSKSLRQQKGLIDASKLKSSLRFETQGKWTDASRQNDKQFERKNKKKIGSEWKY